MTLRPIFKETNSEPDIKLRIRIAGVPTEHLFFLDAWFKRKQMFGWQPCDSELGFNPQAQDWFLNMGLTAYNFFLEIFYSIFT